MIAWSSLFRSSSDRSQQAKQTLQQLRRPDWINDVIDHSHRIAQALRGAPAEKFRAHTERLALSVRGQSEQANSTLFSLAAGAVVEAIRQTHNLQLFDAQLQAGIVISCGAVAEMQTGEGKTLAGVLPAYVHALHGRGVHVATTNSYLADRDHGELSPIFALLGMTTGLLSDDPGNDENQAAYQANVTFGTGHVFGFDFLRDQLIHRQTADQPIGYETYHRVSDRAPLSQPRQRPLYAAIVDEIDHVLIDDAVSPLILSSSSQGVAADAEIHRRAHTVARSLTKGQDFAVDAVKRSVELTSLGFEKVYALDQMAMHVALVRPWHEYVILALRASLLFQRDVHYVVREDEVQIVDESTGRIFEDRSWSDGLHQAVLAAEDLPITPETTSLAKITRQRFYRHYPILGGMTGTAAGCEKEFASVYGLAVCPVPLRIPTRRRIEPAHHSHRSADKYQAIAVEAERVSQEGRAVLIGTLTIAQSHAIARELDQRNLSYQLLNGVQDAEEAAIVANAGQQHAITVATNLAGRGTDIKLSETVRDLGGLHVIVSEHHPLSRVDRQLIGRCARCGDPGSARVFVSADDQLFRRQAPWISRAIERSGCEADTQPTINRQINRLQSEMQFQATSMRWRMLQLDRENESLLDPSSNLSGCWQM